MLGGLLIGVDSLVKAGFATDGLSADAAKKEPARYLVQRRRCKGVGGPPHTRSRAATNWRARKGRYFMWMTYDKNSSRLHRHAWKIGRQKGKDHAQVR